MANAGCASQFLDTNLIVRIGDKATLLHLASWNGEVEKVKVCSNDQPGPQRMT